MQGLSTKKTLLMTSGNPAKRIIAFTLPLLAGEFLHIFYTMTDAFIVGRWLGINGLGAVGASFNLIGFVYGFIFGLSGGLIIITTQRVGAEDEDGTRRSVAAVFFISLTVAVVFMTLLLPLVPHILTLMRTPSELHKNASDYVRIIFSSLGITILYNILAGIIYAKGDSLRPFIFLIIGTACNIILDTLFVVAFSWGVPGAALATVISQLISAILISGFIFRRFRSVLPRRQDWRVGWHEIQIHLSLGIAMGLQRSIVEVGNILVQTAINGLGALTVAAVSAAQRVRALNMMPLFAVSRAVTTYTAQNYGAGKMDRVYKGLFQACLISLGLGVFMATVNQFTGEPIAALFLKDSPEAVALAHRYILYTGYTVFILGIMLVFRSTLQGLGMRRAPILCSVMETAMSILAAFVLIPRIGFTGVCLVNPLSWLASGIPLYIAFGVWKRALLKIRTSI